MAKRRGEIETTPRLDYRSTDLKWIQVKPE